MDAAEDFMRTGQKSGQTSIEQISWVSPAADCLAWGCLVLASDLSWGGYLQHHAPCRAQWQACWRGPPGYKLRLHAVPVGNMFASSVAQS